ncbi:MAG: immune inhibitor A [Chloroflexi bacterium]|nr:immune inhibitor A [Chloroflexota bacterium]
MNRTLATLIAAATLLAAASCCCCTDTDWNWEFFFQPTPIPETPIPGPTPVITREPAGDTGAETEELLRTTNVPVSDLHDLAIRLRGLSPDIPRTINPEGSPDYPVGTRRLFHASNVDTDEQFDIYAILEYKTEHLYMWIEEGARFDRDDLESAAELFEEQTYPTDRAFFGSEWSPGVDNDPHVSILHSSNLGDTVAGYYSMPDEFVSAVREDSNEMEMFYINIENVSINNEFYNGVLAHEFQHMIHWYHDRNEETWLNEGFSELASYLNGFDPGGFEWTFAMNPDTQLNSWPEGPGAAGANYGAGYLFTSYFLDRFGPEATQSLVAHSENSFDSVEAVLEELGTGMLHEDLFADWIVANLLDNPTIADGRYGYEEIDPPSFNAETTFDESDYPISQSSTVHQYGTDYIELHGEQPLTFRFTGSTQIGLMDTTAHSGDYVWWSNRGDESDMTLTRAFDLSDVSEATLEFWAWYDIEEDWDYAYVEISTDGGQTWEFLTTPSGTSTNPNLNSFGWAYTGGSGGETPEWIQERVDLSAYAGQEVLIRFEYITDAAVNRPGFVLDDVAIPEIGYFSDFEEGDDGPAPSLSNGWEAAGFMRHANVLPQRWLVQLILFGPETTVQRLELDEDMAGEWTIPLDGSTDRAVITISGLAPVTTEMASYSYEIEGER